MTVSFRVFGSRLDRVVGDAAGDLVERCLDAGVDSAQRLVPIDTGDLHDDIDVIEEAHVDALGDVVGTYGVTGDLTDYGLHVEFGTSVGPEQPYLRPSVDAVKREAQS